MASYTDQQLLGAVQRQLQPGENVVSVAFGNKPMNMGLQIVLTLVMIGTGILPGLILFLIINASVNKNYVVALTDRRLLVNEVDGSLGMKSTMDFPVPLQGRIAASPKGNFIDFAIFAQRSVEMKFFRNHGPTNYNNGQMIVQALQQGQQMGGPAGAGQPGGGYGQSQMGPGGAPGQLPGGGGYGAPPQLPQGGGYGPPPGGGGYGAPPGGPPGGGYGPPPGGGYGPPGGDPGGAQPGGGYGPQGGAPGGGGHGQPGGGYGQPGGGAPGGGYGPQGGAPGGGAPGGGYGPPPGGGYGPPGGGGGYGPQGGGYGPS